jgi:hypothetical protein
MIIYLKENIHILELLKNHIYQDTKITQWKEKPTILNNSPTPTPTPSFPSL